MENKSGYEVIVRDVEGNILHRRTYPLDSVIGIFNNTYPKELNGWCKSDMVFSNLTEEKKNKMLEHLANQHQACSKGNV